MMNKLLIALLITSSTIHASSPELPAFLKKIDEDRIKTMTAEGFNPDGGVTIVDSSKINAPNSIKSTWQRERQEQLSNGYHKEFIARAKEIMQFPDSINYKYAKGKENTDHNSSVLRKSFSEINMAYNIVPVPKSLAKKVYGYAGANTFKGGWTGFVEFFESNLGTCVFTESNVRLTHEGIKIDREMVQYDVNGKVTTLDVSGNQQSGYLYMVEWFDNDYFRSLECADKNYQPSLVERTMQLAKDIDVK